MFNLTYPATKCRFGGDVSSPLSRRPENGFEPGQLWSLLDMYKLDASAFFHAITVIHDVDKLLRDSQDEDSVMTKHNINSCKVVVQRLLPHLKTLKAALTKIGADRFLRSLDTMPFTYSAVAENMRSISTRLTDELMLRDVYVLDNARSKYFKSAIDLFGKEVEENFPTAIYEIEESGKCYALERFSASAFHSIRLLEVGIRALSRCLGIPDPTRANDRNWGAMLKKIEAEISRRWPGSSTRISGDGGFFDAAYAALAAMQNPWRNATMHLDQKYSPDEARHVMDVVNGFMKKLASRMDENGLPLA